jgi:phage baseplate assembly protein W
MMKRLYNQKVVSSYKASVPEQNQKFFYKGFSSTNKNENFKLYDLDLVKRDLLNHFYIRKGEKLENPRFGTVIWAMLFEQFTEEVKTIIANDVETILNYDPRIAVNDVIIDSTEQGIRIQADITYLRFNVQEKMQFTFDRDNSIVN